MSIDPVQLRTLVVRPALDLCARYAAVPHTPYVEDLLLATAAVETQCGRWLHQVSGPAISIYQFEPSSLTDLIERFIEPRAPRFAPLAAQIGGFGDSRIRVVCDLRLATVLARLFYYRVPQRLPAVNHYTLADLWAYYKPYWNTAAGAADRSEFDNAVRHFTDIRA